MCEELVICDFNRKHVPLMFRKYGVYFFEKKTSRKVGTR